MKLTTKMSVIVVIIAMVTDIIYQCIYGINKNSMTALVILGIYLVLVFLRVRAGKFLEDTKDFINEEED